ncbi:MAG: NAD(P)H-dependent oxidoreductase subunit E [Vicinamibacteria bacterium]|nr:NAD(P)H-dependent oxidoreductase subunit E [Vicinamibacteria bacterium]
MTTSVDTVVREACVSVGHDPTRLMDVAREVQARLGCIPPAAVDAIHHDLHVSRAQVQSLVSFYAFFDDHPTSQITIRVCDDVVDRLAGYDRVAKAFADELGVTIGQTTADGAISLQRTACIGMSDQAPAALVGNVVVTDLSAERARQVVAELRAHRDPQRLIKKLGDGNNAHPLVKAMVRNNIRQAGPIVMSEPRRGEAIRKAAALSPAEVIRAVKTARLRGRGGAGFPTGIKWEMARAAPGARKFVVCNADEGEPGTFKDRVLLTEWPDRVFAGMTIAGYALGAREGILYLRAEYAYLRAFLEDVLARRRSDGLLGRDVMPRRGFEFDIRIQMGAGAYVCGEESALLESCEGRRGDPRNRPPFPAQRGYLGCPTVVNNVETLCCVTRILDAGSAAFSELGSRQSAGTKLLSVSGDVSRPGVYEVPFGTPIQDVLALCGGRDATALQVGGPSGRMVGPADFERTICYDDIATGGALVVFDSTRNPLEIAHAYMEFFEDESCGYCTPCRVGNVLLRKGLEKVLAGRGEPSDLEQFEQIAKVMKAASRCGLGQTSFNPVLSSLQSFRYQYETLVAEPAQGRRRGFDLDVATAEAARIRAGGTQ